MRSQGYWNEERWHATKHEYTFETGTVIEFTSVDTYGKAHGPRRDVLFINEANNLSYKIADQLITRTRKIVWLDWNPSEEFWFYTDMLPSREDIDFITLTYLDNEALDEITKNEIESHRNDKAWWTVYGEGKLGAIETRVYRNWEVVDELPTYARLEGYGLDFGYSNDPNALVAVYYCDGKYYLDEIMYQKGLSNKQIADTILSQDKGLVIADSAEPKSIDEIRSYGVNIVGADKGKDSVNHGIKLIQAAKICVTRRSINVLKAYRNYLWMTDKNGLILDKPNHSFSDAMDAIRYRLTPLLSKHETEAQIFRPKPHSYINKQIPKQSHQMKAEVYYPKR